MGTPNPSSVRQGTPTSNQHHHEGFHLPLPRGRRHGRGRPPVPLQQLLQLLPLHLRLRRRLQPLHLRQLLRHPPLLQARGRGRGWPRPCLQHWSPLPHDLRHPQLRLQPCLPLYLRLCPPLRQRRPLPLHLRLHPPSGQEEAEAEPQYVYSSGVHYPYTYGLHNYGYTHYPYTTAYSHIFKREAEAEPQYYGNYYSRPYGYARTYGYSSYRPYSYSRFGYRGYW